MPWFAAWSGDDLRRGLLPFDDGRVADVAEQLKVAAGDCSGGSLGLLVGRLMFVDLEIHRLLGGSCVSRVLDPLDRGCVMRHAAMSTEWTRCRPPDV